MADIGGDYSVQVFKGWCSDQVLFQGTHEQCVRVMERLVMARIYQLSDEGWGMDLVNNQTGRLASYVIFKEAV